MFGPDRPPSPLRKIARRSRLGGLLPLLACALAMCAGCHRWNWRGRGYEDESSGWTANLRPQGDAKQLTGLDARAQEIERNLGVR